MVDRVVGPELLHEQDDELRDQLSRLQISSELCGNFMSYVCTRCVQSPVVIVLCTCSAVLPNTNWFIPCLHWHS